MPLEFALFFMEVTFFIGFLAGWKLMRRKPAETADRKEKK